MFDRTFGSGIMTRERVAHRAHRKPVACGRSASVCALFILGALLGCQGGQTQTLPRPASSERQVYFSPHGGCTAAIVATLRQAQRQVLVRAYSFTSEPIADAVIGAHQRGVEVKVILDKSQRSERYSAISTLARAGILVLVDTKHAIAHSKVMIIDGTTVITGSFNFTKSAEGSNAENLLVIDDQELAKKYMANWAEHASHSIPYEPP